VDIEDKAEKWWLSVGLSEQRDDLGLVYLAYKAGYEADRWISVDACVKLLMDAGKREGLVIKIKVKYK